MKPLSFFLKKFETLGSNERLVKEKFLKILERDFQIKLESSDLFFRNNNLFVKAEPTARTEIILKKKELLTSLEKEISAFSDSKIKTIS